MGNVNKPPKYTLPYHWKGDVNGLSHLDDLVALISEMLPPLPCVPENELKNDVVSKTMNTYLIL